MASLTTRFLIKSVLKQSSRDQGFGQLESDRTSKRPTTLCLPLLAKGQDELKTFCETNVSKNSTKTELLKIV